MAGERLKLPDGHNDYVPITIILSKKYLCLLKDLKKFVFERANEHAVSFISREAVLR